MNRTERLSALLTLLQSAQSIKARQITERFDIGMRTVYRDIRALEEAGIPITGDSRTGYSLIEGFKLPPLMFTREEAFAFLAAEKLVGEFTDAGLQKSYHSGMDKIRAVMQLTEKKEISAADNQIGTLNFKHSTVIAPDDRLQLLMKSALRRKRIEISYFSQSSQKTTTRMIDPIGIFFSSTNWYMVAFCHQRNEYRTFKVNRIHSIHQTDTIIEKQHPSLDTFLHRTNLQDDLQDVVIQVNSEAFPLIDETKYLNGLVAENLINDSVEMHFRVFSLSRFARWICSYIDIVHIISPVALDREIKGIWEKAIRKTPGNNESGIK